MADRPAAEETSVATPSPQAERRSDPRTIANRLSLLLRSIREQVDRHQGKGVPYTEEELSEVMALEREAVRLGREMEGTLAENPRAADSVIDWILRLEDESTVVRITGMVAGAFDIAARDRLAQVLRGSPSARERRIAALALSKGPDHASVTNLLAASRADADAGVRRTSLESLAYLLSQPGSRDDFPLIRQVAGTLAEADPDEQVRGMAASIARRLDDSGPSPNVTFRARLRR